MPVLLRCSSLRWLVIFRGSIDAGLIVACVLFILYGARLGGYLAYRELKSGSYNRKMKTEIKDGKGMPFIPLYSVEKYKWLVA